MNFPNRTTLFGGGRPGGIHVFHDGAKYGFGNIFFVNSGAAGAGTTSGYGFAPDAPFSTVAAALDSGNLASGDTVLVAAGHTESVSAAAGWDCDTAGITILGCGTGPLRPTITLDTANTADIDIDAANVTFDNLNFVANFLDIAAAIDVNAAGFTAQNCTFRDTSVILNAVIWILGDATTTTANTMRVLNCKFFAEGTANTAAISMPGTPDRCDISDNYFYGDWGTGTILAAGAVTRILIARNLIYNLDAGDDKAINLASSSTGMVAYNGVGIAETDNSVDSIAVGSTVACIQNYSVDIGDRSGILEPAGT